MRNSVLGAALAALVIAARLVAQTPPQAGPPATPTEINVSVIPATGDPTTIASVASRSTLISATSSNCNLAPSTPPTGTIINPTTVAFADPFTPGRECRAPLPSGLATGVGYRIVATFTGNCAPTGTTSITPCYSTTRAIGSTPPFSITSVPSPPVVPTGLGVRP